MADEGGNVLLKIDVDLAGRHERPHLADIQLQAALVHTGDGALDDLAFLQILPIHILRSHAPLRVRMSRPGGDRIGPRGEFDHLPDLRLFLELQQRSDALALAAKIDQHIIGINGDDRAQPVAPAGRDSGGGSAGDRLFPGRRRGDQRRLLLGVQLVQRHPGQCGLHLRIQRRVGISTELLFVRIGVRISLHGVEYSNVGNRHLNRPNAEPPTPSRIDFLSSPGPP